MPAPAASTEEARARMRAVCQDLAAQCDLPPFPKVTLQAMTLTADPAAKTQDVARVVGSDQALAARVLSISRSAVYLRRRPPRTLQDAIVTVGFAVVRQIVVTAAARAVHRPDDPVAQGLWAHALVTALAADELRPPGESPGGISFLAGLLHDIGKLVFYAFAPAAFARLGPDDEALEREQYGVTHALVGGYLLDMWGIDSKIASAVLEHHVRPAYGLAACIAQADWMAHHLGFGSTQTPITLPETDAHPPKDLTALAARVATAFERERTFFD